MDLQEQHREIKHAIEDLTEAVGGLRADFNKHTAEDRVFQERIEPYLQEQAAFKAGANIVKWGIMFLVSIGTLYMLIKGIK